MLTDSEMAWSGNAPLRDPSFEWPASRFSGLRCPVPERINEPGNDRGFTSACRADKSLLECGRFTSEGLTGPIIPEIGAVRKIRQRCRLILLDRAGRLMFVLYKYARYVSPSIIEAIGNQLARLDREELTEKQQ